MKLKIADMGDRTTPVYRCKECPFVEMGTHWMKWTCGKVEGEIVPINHVPEWCPLPEEGEK